MVKAALIFIDINPSYERLNVELTGKVGMEDENGLGSLKRKDGEGTRKWNSERMMRTFCVESGKGRGGGREDLSRA